MTCLNTQSSSLFHRYHHTICFKCPKLCLETPYLLWSSSYTRPALGSLLSYSCSTPNLARLALNSTGLELQTSLPHLWTRMTGVCHLVGRTLEISKLLFIFPSLHYQLQEMNVWLCSLAGRDLSHSQYLFYLTSSIRNQLQMSHIPAPTDISSPLNFLWLTSNSSLTQWMELGDHSPLGTLTGSARSPATDNLSQHKS